MAKCRGELIAGAMTRWYRSQAVNGLHGSRAGVVVAQHPPSAEQDPSILGVYGQSRRLHCRVLRKVFFTGNKKKPEVTDKHVYRIYRKILGFDVLFSDEISKKIPHFVRRIT